MIVNDEYVAGNYGLDFWLEETEHGWVVKYLDGTITHERVPSIIEVKLWKKLKELCQEGYDLCGW
jgi:hypothetical protein